MHIIPPERRGGFDHWIGYENNNSQWDCWVHGGAGDAAFHEKLPGYETDALTERFIEHLKTCNRGRAVPHEPDSAFLQCVIPTGHRDSVDRPWRGIVTREGWKYVVLEGQPWMMFNLNEDSYEQVKLAFNSRFAAGRQVLQDRLAAWIDDTGDQFTLPEL